MRRRLLELAQRPGLPRRTVRLRLTLIYSGLFLICGAVLLTITYLLVSHSSGSDLLLFKTKVAPDRDQILKELSTELGGEKFQLPVPEVMRVRAAELRRVAEERDSEVLHSLLVQSGIALAFMSVVSVAIGWWIAGRVLRPLRTMTATTKRISHENLHERLALQGPDDELKALADTIDALLARLEAAFEAQRRFVANASHELRTPLAMMRTSLDVATGKPDPVPDQVTALDGKLREGLDQADRLLDGFLTLSRAEHGALGTQVPASLPALAAEAVEARRETIAAKRLEVRQPPGDAWVEGNETLLARMVANVVDNAVRHNQPGGWIQIEASERGEVSELVIESGGKRLDPDRVAALAQPFRRLGAERTGSEDGTGLGLSIVAAIAAAHGGGLELMARPRGGLRVAIELPRARVQVETRAEAPVLA